MNAIASRISDSDAPHRAAACRRGHRALFRQACARRRAGHRARLPRARACHLEQPARRRQHRPGRSCTHGRLRSASSITSASTGSARSCSCSPPSSRSCRSTRRIACTTCRASSTASCSSLESGLFGSFTALNFFHWFLFWELSLIPAFFLIKLWGGPRRGPAATQFFVYTMAGSVALLLSFLAIFLSTGSMDFGNSPPWPHRRARRKWSRRIWAPVMPWLAIGVLAGFAVKVPLDALPHLAARRVR